MERLLTPADGAVVELHTRCQAEFSGGADGAVLEDWLKLNRSDKDDCTFPQKAVLEWESDRELDLVEISEDPAFTGARRVLCREKRAEIGNLKMGTAYYWRVNGCEAGKFITQNAAPRWMEVDGISNVRDMGAWRTVDGRRVKQGLIYRGSEMDTHHTITDAGRRVFIEEMGIKTDLDLRGEAVGCVTESPAGSGIDYLLMPCVAYEAFMKDEQKPVCRALFEVLADENAYPIYFHCWGGADRTGTLALMLEAVLGLSDADMMRDYELTSLSVWGERSINGEWFRSLMRELDAYGSKNDGIRDKALAFLRSCGVTDELMEKIRINMLE